MSLANIITLAEAVTYELNNESWTLPFIARREYRPRFDTSDLRTLQVSVVPRSVTIEAATRIDDRWECQIDVAVQQKLEFESIEEIDPLLALVDEIIHYFKSRRLASASFAICSNIANEPVYAVEHLDELRCFTSIITLTFRFLD